MTTRRDFLLSTAALALATSAGQAAPKKPKLKKAVKYSMVAGTASPLEKFELLKRLGFQGVEIDSPNSLDLPALVAAKEKTGILIHGVIDSAHWTDTLSSPDEAVRAKGLAALRVAIGDAKTVGADTVLLVPGVVNTEVT